MATDDPIYHASVTSCHAASGFEKAAHTRFEARQWSDRPVSPLRHGPWPNRKKKRPGIEPESLRSKRVMLNHCATKPQPFLGGDLRLPHAPTGVLLVILPTSSVQHDPVVLLFV